MKSLSQRKHEARKLKNGTTRPYFHDDNIKYTTRNTYAVNSYGKGGASFTRIL